MLASVMLAEFVDQGLARDEARSQVHNLGQTVWEEFEPEDAQAWADTWPEGELRDWSRDIITEKVAKDDVASAVEWIAQIKQDAEREMLPDDHLGKIPVERVPVDAVARALAKEDPMQALGMG